MDFRISPLSFLFFFAFLAAAAPRLFSEEPLGRPDVLGAQLYSIGQPSAEEQLYLEYINRARANPTAEGVRLASTNDANVRAAYQSLGVNLTLMQAQLAAILPQPPLSMNATLTSIARAHSQDMLANHFQGHVGSNGSTTESRVIGSGYTANAGYLYGENVFSYALSPSYGHASFEVDWGGTPANGGMQVPPGHRQNIHSANFREVGLGVVLGSNQGVGPQLVTQNFGSRSDALPLVTGVVYRDANGNGFYDVGEGVGGVTVTIAGSDHYAISAGSGGYSVPVPQDGIYAVTFGGGSAPPTTRTVAVTGGQNVKLDYLPVGALAKGDLNGDGASDIIWQNNVTGQRGVWLMNRTVIASVVFLSDIILEWRIAGTGDFNNDGQTDILWQNNRTGERGIWLMHGTTLVQVTFLPTIPVEWEIATTGDFNQDGQTDLVWQNNVTGERGIWLMHGTSLAQVFFLPTIPLEWKIVGAGDLTGDGQTDLVWENRADGQRGVWRMNGTTFAEAIFLPSAPTEWRIAGTGDYNGDGLVDLLWQNAATGERGFWFMNGTTMVGFSFLPTIPLEWEVVNH